ncbi:MULTISPECIES: hypothetical protein [Sphingomonas]|uniref:hypothetical protein n=1 Tax=Sphingomonas sp. S-NIH.Pt1_0416 TaxID=1920123 RepID=UPI001E575A90|nr:MULTISPECIES: hypothetical protein [Sphingomonas]MCM3678795.1 hypothetical protein [Sphingomonas paucimobilis]
MAVLAMPVIRPLISLIRPLIRCNACPVSTTSLLPVPTCSELAVIAAALSSSEAACCSVRRDRSSAAERISSVPLRMTPEVCETPPMVVHSESIAALKSVRSSAKRSGKSSVIRPVNCPAARPRIRSSSTVTACRCSNSSALESWMSTSEPLARRTLPLRSLTTPPVA